MRLQICYSDMHSFPDMFLYIFTIIISGVITKINTFYQIFTLRRKNADKFMPAFFLRNV